MEVAAETMVVVAKSTGVGKVAKVATNSMEAMLMGMGRIEERFVCPPLLQYPPHISVLSPFMYAWQTVERGWR